MLRKSLPAALIVLAVASGTAPLHAQGYPTIDSMNIEQAMQILSSAQQMIGQLDNLNGVMGQVQQAIGTAADSIPIDMSKWTGQLSTMKAIRVTPDLPTTGDIQTDAAAIQAYFYSANPAPTRDEIDTIKQRRLRTYQRAALNAYQIAAASTKMMESAAQDLAELEAQANGSTKLMTDNDVQLKAMSILIARQTTSVMLQAATIQLSAAQAIAADSNYTIVLAK